MDSEKMHTLKSFTESEGNLILISSLYYQARRHSDGEDKLQVIKRDIFLLLIIPTDYMKPKLFDVSLSNWDVESHQKNVTPTLVMAKSQ